MKNMQRVGVTEGDAGDKMRWRQVVDLMVLLSFAVSVPTVGLFPWRDTTVSLSFAFLFEFYYVAN